MNEYLRELPLCQQLQNLISFPPENTFVEPDSESLPKPTITFAELTQAHNQGPLTLQELKHEGLVELEEFRRSTGVETNYKTQAQIELQRPISAELPCLGDPNTWMLDPKDIDSCLAVARYLFEVATAKELWMGLAIQDDFVDPKGDKNKTPPLIRKLTNLAQVEEALEKLNILRQQFLTGKLAKRLAKHATPTFNDLLEKDKQQSINNQLNLASEIVETTNGNKNAWNKLNEILAQHDIPTLSPENHFLIKMFRQDVPTWQLVEMILTTNSEKSELILEVPNQQYTSRKEDKESGTSEPLPQRRIKIITLPHGKPIIIAEKEDLKWLTPLLNSIKFWETFDECICKTCPPTPYRQIQFMLNIPVDESGNRLLQSDESKVIFVTDVIAGVHEINPLTTEEKPNVVKFLEMKSRALIFPPELERTILTRYSTLLNTLLNTLVNTIYSKETENNTLQAKKLLEIIDISTPTAHNTMRLPPSTKQILRKIAEGLPPQQPISTLIASLQNKLMI